MFLALNGIAYKLVLSSYFNYVLFSRSDLCPSKASLGEHKTSKWSAHLGKSKSWKKLNKAIKLTYFINDSVSADCYTVINWVY